jgi:hypothetical protein
MLAELRAEHDFVVPGSAFCTYVVRRSANPPIWWTFAGSSANSALGAGLADLIDPVASVGGLRIRLRADASTDRLRKAIG